MSGLSDWECLETISLYASTEWDASPSTDLAALLYFGTSGQALLLLDHEAFVYWELRTKRYQTTDK